MTLRKRASTGLAVRTRAGDVAVFCWGCAHTWALFFSLLGVKLIQFTPTRVSLWGVLCAACCHPVLARFCSAVDPLYVVSSNWDVYVWVSIRFQLALACSLISPLWGLNSHLIYTYTFQLSYTNKNITAYRYTCSKTYYCLCIYSLFLRSYWKCWYFQKDGKLAVSLRNYNFIILLFLQLSLRFSFFLWFLWKVFLVNTY